MRVTSHLNPAWPSLTYHRDAQVSWVAMIQKSNCFLKIIQLLGGCPKLFSGNRQCGFQEGAAEPHVPLQEACGTGGQEHHEAQGHPRALENILALKKWSPHIQGSVGFILHPG